jgi:hypothetical protein
MTSEGKCKSKVSKVKTLKEEGKKMLQISQIFIGFIKKEKY